jgi:hypothetical protein
MDEQPDTREKEENSQPPNKKTAQPRHGWWRRIIYIERKMDERRAKREECRAKRKNETTEQEAARLTAEATRWIAVFTVVMAIVAGLTLWELIQGGADTRALVDASRKQACAASKSAKAARDFADTAALINSGIGDAVKKLAAQAKASQKSADAAKSAADTARDALILDQRPWIGIAKTPSAGEIEKYPDSFVRIKFRFENFGKSPAINIAFSGAVVASPIHPKIKGNSFKQNTFTRTLGNCMNNPYQFGNDGLLLPTQYLDETAIGGIDPRDVAAAEEPGGKMWLYATGCFDYDDMVGGPHHQLLFCFFYDPQAKAFGLCDEGYKTRDGEYWKEKPPKLP